MLIIIKRILILVHFETKLQNNPPKKEKLRTKEPPHNKKNKQTKPQNPKKLLGYKPQKWNGIFSLLWTQTNVNWETP